MTLYLNHMGFTHHQFYVVQWVTEGTSVVRYFIARLHKSAIMMPIRDISSLLLRRAVALERSYYLYHG